MPPQTKGKNVMPEIYWNGKSIYGEDGVRYTMSEAGFGKYNFYQTCCGCGITHLVVIDGSTVQFYRDNRTGDKIGKETSLTFHDQKDKIESLKQLLKSAHYLLKDCPGDTWESEFQKWLSEYNKAMNSLK